MECASLFLFPSLPSLSIFLRWSVLLFFSFLLFHLFPSSSDGVCFSFSLSFSSISFHLPQMECASLFLFPSLPSLSIFLRWSVLLFFPFLLFHLFPSSSDGVCFSLSLSLSLS